MLNLYYIVIVVDIYAFPGRHWKSYVPVIKTGTTELLQYKLFIKLWELNG